MPGLGLAGLIAIAFGVIPVLLTDELTPFSLVNFALGGLAILAGAFRAVARLRAASEPVFRRALVRGAAGVLAVAAVGAGLTWLADRSGAQLDWSMESRFELSPATRQALEAAADGEPLEAFLYRDPFDPRIRSTRLLLETLAAAGPLSFSERELDAHPDEEDCFAVGSSNTVVITRGAGPPCSRRFQRIDRPTEGTAFEALYRLREREGRVVLVSRGAGEPELERRGDTGLSGFAEALVTEGYEPVGIPLAALDEVPEQVGPGRVAALIVPGPRRALTQASLDALERYLEGGGRLVALLEPGVDTGLEPLLARWGLDSGPEWVVDPFSVALAGGREGLAPLARHYDAYHPVTELLSGGRASYFPGTRAFQLRKPRPDDRVDDLVNSSDRAWLAADPEVLDGWPASSPKPPATADYRAMVVAGRYPRTGEARIVAFGDSDLATNRFARTLYNLDLLMNAVHWVSEREPEITLRPKVGVSGALQFPVPLGNTLTMFQSLGLLLPELLLIAGAMVWLRSRSS